MKKQRKDRWNVGDIPEVTADEDVDHDVEVGEATRVREDDIRRAAARRRLEQLREEGKR